MVSTRNKTVLVLVHNCVAISISFKFEAPAGYADCRLSTVDYRLSIVAARQAG